MAKTWTRSNDDKAAEFAGGLNAFYAGGSVRFLDSEGDVIATQALHDTTPFTVSAGVANVQRNSGGGFNAASITPSADGTIAFISINKSDGTEGRRAAAAETGSGGAADAVLTMNNLTVTTLSPIVCSSDLTITVG